MKDVSSKLEGMSWIPNYLCINGKLKCYLLRAIYNMHLIHCGLLPFIQVSNVANAMHQIFRRKWTRLVDVGTSGKFL